MQDKIDAHEFADDDRKVLLAVTVEIEEGQFEDIEVREGYSAKEVSTKFCEDHCLPTQLITPLKQHITSKLSSISKDKGKVVNEEESHVSEVKNIIKGYPSRTATILSERKYVSQRGSKPDRCGSHRLSTIRPLEEVAIQHDTPRKCSKRETFSQHFLAPTIASSGKIAAAHERDQINDTRSDRLSCGEIWQARLTECTFMPNLYHQDWKQDKNQSCLETTRSCFDKLFLDAENRQERLVCYMRYPPDRVTSCSSTNKHAPTSGFDVVEDLRGGSVYNRLVCYAAKITEKRNKIEDQNIMPLNSMLGERLFRSSTGCKQHAKVSGYHI
ncbi:hypothetical protein O6H91_01G047100 [Diphasiastrum complanatum]|uniref:Uncharacterized protein n=1 Tax=Diphasiastrum complanatum TaxID=34168 RepID=A0ACC2EQJ5_DIPCM|nr:hypothetical protein O6H91_01G047100 [Diphasiastrum complanatum]